MEKTTEQRNADILSILKTLGVDGVETKANESMHSTQSGYGDDFVPTVMANEVIEAARDQSTVLSKIPTVWDMPSNPFEVPVEGDDAQFYLTAENTDVPGTEATTSKAGTSKVTLTAKKITANVFLSGELDEDSIVAAQPYVQNQLAKQFAEAVDAMIINGDTATGSTGNINSDDAARAAGSVDLAFDGLRKHAFAGTGMTTSIGTVDASSIMDTRKLLGGKYGNNPDDLLIVSNPETYFQLQTLAQVETIDKVGSAATIVNGRLASIYGIEIVSSSQFGLTEADGKISTVTPANNVKGGFVIVHKPSMVFGWKRRMKLFVDYIQGTDQYQITAHSRLAFDLARDNMVALGYNATV